MNYLDELFSLRGLNAVVTGGSSGIGRGMATALAKAGAAVHIVARDEHKLRAVADDIGAAWSSFDVAHAEALQGLCDSEPVREADILVTCAGVNPRPPMLELTEHDYAETMRVNLEAPFRLGQAAASGMVVRGFGRIINIGSQQTWSAFGNSGVYGVSKAAIAGLSRSQAEAWSRHGVTANTIVPGFVVTPMTQPTIAIPGREEALATRSLVGRNGVPEDFATVVLFLCSRSSGFVTGQTIAVDGGFSVH